MATTTGFRFSFYGKDYFVPSNLVEKTKGIAKKIVFALASPVTEMNINWMFDHIEKCDMEKTSYGYRIFGYNYGNKFTLFIPAGEREDFVIMEV